MAAAPPPRTPAKPDPKVPRNRKCVVCGKPLTPISLQHNDPYCSSPCARKYHGNELPTKSPVSTST